MKNISDIFNEFSGKKVTVAKRKDYKAAEKSLRGPWEVAVNDPVMRAITEKAQEAGLSVRVHLPGDRHKNNLQRDRLNVFVDKDKSGVWRVQPVFTIQ